MSHSELHIRTIDTATLKNALDHAAHYLPVQGPIGVFIHHNTLHAFQHLPFEEAVVKAARVFGNEPFMQEEAYARDFHRGRILEEDVRTILQGEANEEVIGGRLDRRALRIAMLVPGLRNTKDQRAEWLLKASTSRSIGENGWLKAFRTDVSAEAQQALANDTPRALWDVCVARARPLTPPVPTKAIRPQEAILSSTGFDIDAVVHPVLIDLTSVYVDQGLAHWRMPGRDHGLLSAARANMGGRWSPDPSGLAGVGPMFRSQQQRGISAEETVLEALATLGVDAASLEYFLRAELLALPGWGGLVRKLENEPVLAAHERVRCSLMDFLSVRLTLTVAAVRNAVRDPHAWRELVIPAPDPAPLTRELRLFDVAQLLGLSSNVLKSMDDLDFDRLCGEIDRFDDVERRRVWHLAYERRHERLNLLPLAKHRTLPPVVQPRARWAADVFFCIDEREESTRRALEEVDAEMRTYGAAGFFGCAMNFTANDDPQAVDLCPVVLKPAHAVSETPRHGEHTVNDKRQRARKSWAAFAYSHNAGSRNLLRGWISHAITGPLAIVPLLVRIISPLTWFRLHEKLAKSFVADAKTSLDFHREQAEAKNSAGLLKGFTTNEMADRVGGMLGTVGLVKDHARLVVFLGHGSTSLNNPHESAHDCGACGGRRGGANGRLFAAMANRPDVRALLKERGIAIPEDTWFIGGYHDTSSDDVDLTDTDLVPATHREEFKRLRTSLDGARAWSAHERARRFEAAGPGIDAAEGLRHVQERAQHLAEPRPEYGHCTNAVCIVGRRDTTRGLFFDRRAFLVSYDAHNDPLNKALAGVLGAVIPVCGGISLEYYFSFVDNEGYGCGTKLPHNVTGLIGVMNGYKGDLRTGLPLQMVEIHEPVRILFVVETTPERLMPIIDANPELTEFVKNRWIRLSTMDPDTGMIKVYRDGVWEDLSGDEVPLPRSSSSAQYYSGTMEHLPVARIEPVTLAGR